MTAMRSGPFSHWKTAFEKNKSTFSSVCQVFKSATWKSTSGKMVLALLIMSGDESRPVTLALG